MTNLYHPESEIAELATNNPIVIDLAIGVVMWAVDEDADAWNTLALVIEVGLDMNIWAWLVLCKIREAMAILVKVIEELALEGRCGIDVVEGTMVAAAHQLGACSALADGVE